MPADTNPERLTGIINGRDFQEKWTVRRGAQTLLCYIDGKLIARKSWKEQRAAARAAEAASGDEVAS